MLTDFLVNPNATAVLPEAHASRAPLALHRKLPYYAPTPLIDAPALAAKLEVGRVWVKNESARMHMPAYKILGASWASYYALNARLQAATGHALPEWQTIPELVEHLDPLRPLTLAAATDGNHGRAVARVAALLNFGAHIFVPTGTAQARIEAIASEGAQVTVVDGTYDDAVARSAAEEGPHCAVISDTSWPGYEDIPRRVIEGYGTIFAEIDEELAHLHADRDEPPDGHGLDLVAVQTGVGALAAAVVNHYRAPDAGMRPRILNVEPTSAACVLASMRAGELVEVPGPHTSIMAGLNCGLPSLVAWPLVSRGVDVCVAVDDEQARQAMRDLAAVGVVAGETGAAGLAGLTATLTGPGAAERRVLLGVREHTRVLVLVTEGATDPAAYRAIVGSEPPALHA